MGFPEGAGALRRGAFVEEAVKSGLPLRRALEAAHEREWGGRRYGRPTLEDWYYAYRHHGLAGLEDIPRKDKGHVRALARRR